MGERRILGDDQIRQTITDLAVMSKTAVGEEHRISREHVLAIFLGVAYKHVTQGQPVADRRELARQRRRCRPRRRSAKKHGNSSLGDDVVRRILVDVTLMPRRAVMVKYGIRAPRLSDIINGFSYRHLINGQRTQTFADRRRYDDYARVEPRRVWGMRGRNPRCLFNESEIIAIGNHRCPMVRLPLRRASAGD